MADFEKHTSAFVNWLAGQNVVLSKVEIQDRRTQGFGRCVIATEDIDPDQVIFTVPRPVLLNAENCLLVQHHPETKDQLQQLTQWQALMAALLYEWKAGSSHWLPYLDVLPLDSTQNNHQLTNWSEDELAQLKPSLILDRVGHGLAKTLHEKIVPVLSFMDVTIEDVHRVASVIMAYSFDVDKSKSKEDDDDDEEEEDDDDADPEIKPIAACAYLKSMVPLADTLNAHTKLHNASLMYTEEDLVMKSIKHIPKGAQVYNTYLEHSNAELLRRYGYVEQQGSAYDYGEVPLTTVKKYFAENSSLSLDTIDETIDILREIESEEGESFVLDTFDCYSSSEVTLDFVFIVQFFVIISAINHQREFNSALLDVKARALRRVFKKCYQLLESKKVTAKFMDSFPRIAKLRMAEYPKTATKGFPEPRDTQLTRAEMARIVLVSEYEALNSCLDAKKVFQEGEMQFGVIDDDKLLRNILKKDIFEGKSDHKKIKLA